MATTASSVPHFQKFRRLPADQLRSVLGGRPMSHAEGDQGTELFRIIGQSVLYRPLIWATSCHAVTS